MRIIHEGDNIALPPPHGKRIFIIIARIICPEKLNKEYKFFAIFLIFLVKLAHALVGDTLKFMFFIALYLHLRSYDLVRN